MTPSGSRITIWRLMALIAACAMTLGVVRDQFARNVVAGGLVVLAAGGLMRAGIEGAWGVRCPGCGRRGMRCRAVRSFRARYYRCDQCQRRWWRALGFWRDASGGEHDAAFRPRVAPPAPGGSADVTEAGDDAGTAGVLLRHQRNRRRPDS